MTPNLLFYQLLLVAPVLICLIIHVWWPDPASTTPLSPLKPDKPRRKRSKEPIPFTGYIHKPLWEAGEQGADSRPHVPGAPPPMVIFTRGRRRTVDTSGHFCPDHDCSYHGWLGRGHIRSNGHPGGQTWRQFQCLSCQGYFVETTGTIFHAKRSSPELIVHIRGRWPKPHWMPRPGLLYAQVVQRTRRRRLVEVSHRVVMGIQAQVDAVLPPATGRSIRPLSSGSI